MKNLIEGTVSLYALTYVYHKRGQIGFFLCEIFAPFASLTVKKENLTVRDARIAKEQFDAVYSIYAGKIGKIAIFGKIRKIGKIVTVSPFYMTIPSHESRNPPPV